MTKEYYVYIMTNKINSILYTGVTNDLKRRVFEHKNKLLGKALRRNAI
jgi:putative endonuclease